jgi:hypothetical protein
MLAMRKTSARLRVAPRLVGEHEPLWLPAGFRPIGLLDDGDGLFGHIVRSGKALSGALWLSCEPPPRAFAARL